MKGVSPATGIGTVRRGAIRSVGVAHVIGGLATARRVIMDFGDTNVTNGTT